MRLAAWTRTFVMVVVGTATLAVLPAAHASPVPIIGGAFSTDNAGTDGLGSCLFSFGHANCNIYRSKDFVWLNGSPGANSLFPRDGNYLFTVLAPSWHPDPNDCSAFPSCAGDQNLSDDYDCWQNRVFKLTNGGLSNYPSPTGPALPPNCFPPPVSPFQHWLDSGGAPNGRGTPNNQPPFIRLFPYTNTNNPVGVYIMAVCSLASRQPPNLRVTDCKYDAFKIPNGDTSQPQCQLTSTINGNPKQIQVTVQDPQSGLEKVDYTIYNGTVSPDGGPYTTNPDGSISGSADLFVGMVSPFVLTATKTNQALGSRVVFTVNNVAGQQVVCDPVLPATKPLHLLPALSNILSALERIIRL
jgi:hypothetical protein